ncbi:MAG: HD domain-containing protein [Coriobacteriales bacterium]|nr:HD domain-containing protein [Coriobacteriales bacterium]
MHTFVQHGNITTYAHVLRVARTALRWSEALHVRVSDSELVRGALLHDYYLYDWHEPNHTGHATKHPLFALHEAEIDFDLTQKERNIIAAHMWPLPPNRIPKSREAWLVCAADKWCSLQETLFMRK